MTGYYEIDDEEKIFLFLKDYGFYKTPSRNSFMEMFDKLVFCARDSNLSVSFAAVKKLLGLKSHIVTQRWCPNISCVKIISKK